MNKNKTLEKIANLLSRGLRHKIGSIVNAHDAYASKYEREAESLFQQAKRASTDTHWNNDDKEELKKRLRNRLQKELVEKEYIHERKFEIMDKEIEEVLKRLGLL